uniref:Putative cytidylyltransferase n=1 Tax=viral metagenome TaxID=1070528 RepID=A0A6M3K9V0_9ZZZZ
MIVGYTSGVFDLFHIGHLNILRNSKSMCDHLIVGVSTDDLVVKYKKKNPIIPMLERIEILRHIIYVDTVIVQEDMDKMKMWRRLKFNILFVGDDWFDTLKWQEYEKDFNKVGVRVIYFPYYRGTSSTKINQILDESR